MPITSSSEGPKLMLGPQIARIPISDEVIHRMRDLIARGVIPAGSKLPPERDLVEALGISRPTLRQALRALQILGVIQSRQGSGSYVAASTTEMLKVPLQFALALKQVGTTDLLETRVALEVKMAEMAAQRRNAQDLNAMREALSDMQRTMGSPDDYCLFEIRFHECVIQAAHNAVMGTIMEMLSPFLRESRMKTVKLLKDYSKSYQSHLDVFLAIEQGDSTAAFQAMDHHFAIIDHGAPK